MRWEPTKPRQPITVVECGLGLWEERDHGLDIPHAIETFDFKVTGTGHRRIEFQNGCLERGRKFSPYNDEQPEQRIAMWICCNATYEFIG